MRVLSKMFGGWPVVAAVTLASVLMMTGCGDSPSSSAKSVTAQPTFNPGAGSYNASQTVTISNTTPGAVLYCTTDGSLPTTSSPICSQPTTIFKTEFLQAMAVAPNMDPSPVAAAAYTINLNATATPTFTPAGGNYTTTQSVTIADATSGANIYYTLDGTVPSPSSALYTGPVLVSQTQTITAYATSSGFSDSAVASATYNILPAVTAPPLFTPAAGTYTTTQSVQLSDTTANSTIYYTTDGTTPTAMSMPYTTPISVATSQTISAIAIALGTSSSVATSNYVIMPAVAATPIFTPAAGTYNSAQSVQLSDTTAGASIFYTTDGTPATPNSTPYTGPINVSTTSTVNAIAVATGFTNSPVGSAAYTINAPAAAPTFSVAAGTYTSVQTVELSDTTPGSTIYYTTNNTVPTTLSMMYTTALTVSSTQTVQAIATASGFGTSPVASAMYTINLPGTVTPTITPASGTYNSPQSVTISDATASSTIYYTTDGTPATALSTQYTGSFTISTSGTVNAIAVAAGGTSPMATASYVIQLFTNSLTGSVMGGSTPINGASVQLYTAGSTSGYGAGAVTLGDPVTTAADGTFTLGFNCPAAPGDQVYLIATGGDAGAGPNSATVLMAALGSCAPLTSTTPVVVNEVTTVAAAYSLAQFSALNTSGQGIIVGTSTGNAIGLSNSMKTHANLVDATGAALAITPFYAALGGTSGGVLNSSYVPQARINTLADILASCVESASGSSACSSLFAAATPPNGTAPSDTLQAITNIAQNPGSNTAAVYGLYAGGQPFQPALTSAPNDWALALTFTGGGLGQSGNDSEPADAPAVGKMSIDAQGNVWLTANSLCLDPNTFNSFNGLVEFDNFGNALSPAATASNSYCGAFQPQLNGSLAVGGADITIDMNGLIWVSAQDANNNPSLAKISSDGMTVQSLTGTQNPATNESCLSNDLQVDGLNDIWAGCSNFQGNGSIFEFSGADGSVIGEQSNDAGFTMLSVGSISLDNSGNVWGVTANSGAVTFSNLYQVSAIDGLFTLISDHSTSGATFYNSVVADGVGDVFSPSTTPGVLSELAPDGTTVNSLNYPLPTGATGMEKIALDGVGHLWGTVYGGPTTAIAPVPSYLVEMAPDGTILSPSGTNVYGYNGTGGGGETQPIMANFNIFGGTTAGVAVDSSGNIWVANASLGSYFFDPSSRPPVGEQLVEFIGIAPPAATPLVQQLVLNKIGARP